MGTPLLFLIVSQFLQLTGPDHQLVEVNTAEIVALRVPRNSDHFAVGTHCLIFTTDGKHLSVTETCRQIDSMLKNGK